MAHLLGAEALHLEFPTKVVFDSVTLGLNEGDRVGVVGRNGDGKTSLLVMLAGRLRPDSGRVTVRGGVRIGVLDQADTLDETLTVAETVVGDTPEHVWAGDARVRDVIRGLLTGIPWDAPVAGLSGGQRRRVTLAGLLAGEWEVLLLDEPTNHLDVEAITWLAGHLKRRWPASAGGLLVITHDRWFLDEVSNATWEVHDRIVEPFDGGYAAYILQRVERDRMTATSEAKRQNLARKELAWLRRGAPARTSKPKFHIEAANALIADVPEIRDKVSLQSLAVARLGRDVVDLLDVSAGYDGTEVLHDIEWRIAPGERTGVLGVNGAGKSTLLGLVTGTVKPSAGTVRRGKTVRVAALTQRLGDLEDHLDEPVRAILDRLRASYTIGSGSRAQDLSPGQLLERLGFSTAQLSTPVRDLSGGQQRRLQLLLILLDQPNVLILDEPTNDMDTDMLAVIEDLLDSWPGTLLVVSHDRYFVERVTDQQYAILDGGLRHLPGGIDEYLRLRARAESAAADPVAGGTTARGTAAGPAGAASSAGPAPAPPALSGAARRDAQKEVASVERRLARLQAQIDGAKNALGDHDPADYQGLNKRLEEIAQLEADVTSLEERWFELTELTG
ncbi:MAG TPA: ABC-F family ATP-binding cassette domain-containing protein [Trebonia sp.]